MVDIQLLKEALYNEYEYICHEDYDPDDPNDMSPEEYREVLKDMSYDECVEDSGCMDEDELVEYIECHTYSIG